MLVVAETHPVQYHAPVYRTLQQEFGVPVTAVYGSDFSVAGYRDREFGTTFAWDTDLTSGYTAMFLSRAAGPATVDVARISPDGIDRALQSLDPGAVMVVGYRPRFHRAAWYAAWRQRIPLLFRGETSDVAQPRSGPRQWIRSSSLRLGYSRCRALLYIGQHSREHYRRLGVPEERLFFSPYCVDATTFEAGEEWRAGLREEARRTLELADDRVLVLYSGKLSTRKGIDLILPALRALPPERRDRVVLALLGDGDRRDETLAAAAAEPKIAVRFLGFQNQRQLSRFYHAADLLVLPSRWAETWGLVVNEALLHGVPCVVSDRVGCAPDLVVSGVTGETFPSESVPGFTAAIDRAWDGLVGRAEVRDACRRLVDKYSVRAAAHGIAEAFHAAVPARTRHVS